MALPTGRMVKLLQILVLIFSRLRAQHPSAALKITLKVASVNGLPTGHLNKIGGAYHPVLCVLTGQAKLEGRTTAIAAEAATTRGVAGMEHLYEQLICFELY